MTANIPAHFALIILISGLGTTCNAIAIETGEPAPQCLLTLLNKKQQTELPLVNSKLLYVDFWASWCPPCLKSFPFMNSLMQTFGSELDVVAINLDEERQLAHAFLEKQKTQFTVAFDNNSQCAEAFAVKAMPSSYLIDQQGIVQHIHLGFRSGDSETISKKIAALLATTPAETEQHSH